MQVSIKHLVDDVQCYQTVRELRWPNRVASPSCESTHVIKRGFDDTAPARQRYECHDCDTRFDDLTDPIFAGHHQPLQVWIWCTRMSTAFMLVLRHGAMIIRVSTMAGASTPEMKMATAFVKCTSIP